MAETFSQRKNTPIRFFRFFRIEILIVILLGSNSACDSCNRSAKNSADKDLRKKRSDVRKPETAPVAVVEGIVKLKSGAPIPSYSQDQMSQQVLRSKPTQVPKTCSAANQLDRQPVRLTQEGNLVGVLVAASKVKHPPTREPRTHDITIEDCRLKPSFVAAQKGDKLRIQNLTDFPFMPQLGPSAFMETLIKGQEKLVDLNQGGFVGAVLCGYTASCGRTDVIVLFDALYAVTDDNGHFRIENYPAGQKSLVNVWHPLFRETSTSVTLTPGETKQLVIELSPLEKYTVEKPPAMNNKPTKQ